MNSRERIFSALNHKEPDRIPIDIGGTSCSTLTEPVYHKLVERYKLKGNNYTIVNPAMRSVNIDKEVKDFLHSDTNILCVNEPTGGRITFTENGFIDEWGVKYIKSKSDDDFYYDIYQHPLANAEIGDLKKYKWPDPNDTERYKGLKEKAKKASQEKYFLLGNILESSIFEVAWYLRGFQEFLIDLMINKKFAHMLLEKITTIQKTIYEKFLEEVGQYIDMVFIADDLATQENLLFSPEVYQEMIKPYQKEYFSVKKKNNLKLLYHCCGNIYPLLGELIEIGVDAINPVQVSAREMGPERLKKSYGDQLTFWGGIDTQTVLNSQDPEFLVNSINKIIEVFAPGGGFVLSSVHNIQNDVPAENIKRMVETAMSNNPYTF